MLEYPHISPIAFNLGPVAIHWYGLAYLAGFMLAWVLALYRAKRLDHNFTNQQVSDFIFYAAIGVIIGGRLGYVVFYQTDMLWHDPLEILRTWRGGMSFHGGLIGVGISLWLFARHTQKKFLVVADFAAPLVPLGIALGRVANFINGELWGRITDVPWGVVFPGGGALPRHPSQLYEASLEGVALFIILWWYASKPRPTGAVAGWFLVLYASMRFIVEFWREPDNQLGFVFLNWLTMGQILSLPMLAIGMLIVYSAAREQKMASV